MTNLTLLSMSETGRRITRLGRIAGKVEAEIHLLAVSSLDHIREHGDTRNATALCQSLPKGQRVEALMFWFKHFSNKKVLLRRDSKTGVILCQLEKDRDEADFDIVAASQTTFADLTAEKAPGKTLTVSDLLNLLKQKANNTKLNDDGSPKVAESARELASDLLAYVESKVKAA